MQSLGGSSRPLLAEASALYQELDTLRSWHPIFPAPLLLVSPMRLSHPMMCCREES